MITCSTPTRCRVSSLRSGAAPRSRPHGRNPSSSRPCSGRFTELTGKVPILTMGETLLQVVNHSTYHRGQINSRLREVGGTPPMTDFIAWVGLGKPVVDWPRPEQEDASK